MPRKARAKSNSGIYHIMMRGINRQIIFEDEEDYNRFIHTLKRYKGQCGYEIYAYCLMSNHIHLLIKIGKEPLEQVMRRLCGSYVYWYNQKYQRIGNLFQDRFKSEVVDDEAYFLTVLRYIHQNPLKAGLVKEIEEYKWSSYIKYTSNEKNLVDIEFALNLFNITREKALINFIKFNKEANNDVCLDIDEKRKVTDEQAKELIKNICKVNSLLELKEIDKKTRDIYLRKLKENNLSIRQIERLTGINRGVIAKA